MHVQYPVVFTGGTVFDGEALLAPGTDVVIDDGTITAIGPGLAASAAASATIVELDGGLLLPGFIDAHVHPIEGGLERMRCDLSEGATREDYLRIVAEYADANPDAPWILGGGWQMAAFPGGVPLASDLDAIVGDRLVFLSNRDHHGSWVSSATLAAAGITADTPDPADGRIERDASGAPSGVLQEGARLLVTHLVPEDTEDDNYEALLSAQAYLHSLGVTGWQDAIVGDYGNHSDTGDVYLRAAKNGDLTARVVAALWWDREKGIEQLPGLLARRAELQHDRFAATSIKIMQDGIPENQTAAMIDPYFVGGCRCGDSGSGISFVDPAVLTDYVTALDAEGFQVHFHAIGDRAVREALDSLEETKKRNGESDGRHHIAHIQIVHPDDVPRFAEIGVAANLQALWATWEPQMVDLNLPVLGDERASWQYPFGDIARSGARLGAGSDWPVTNPNPWLALHVAVNRTFVADDPDYTDLVFFPEQSLDLATAIAAYTAGSAYLNHSDSAGRIRVGFDADLVITDRDPFAGEPDDIGRTRTTQTWVRGHRVF